MLCFFSSVLSFLLFGNNIISFGDNLSKSKNHDIESIAETNIGIFFKLSEPFEENISKS